MVTSKGGVVHVSRIFLSPPYSPPPSSSLVCGLYLFKRRTYRTFLVGGSVFSVISLMKIYPKKRWTPAETKEESECAKKVEFHLVYKDLEVEGKEGMQGAHKSGLKFQRALSLSPSHSFVFFGWVSIKLENPFKVGRRRRVCYYSVAGR